MRAIATIQLNIDETYFNEAYLPILESTEREVALYGGGGSGKSYFGVQYMILKALIYPGRRILVVRKVQNSIRESVFEDIKQTLSDMKILEYCKVTTAHMNITFPNGSRFIFTGLDDSEKIKSISGIDDIMIEEATELSLDDYTQLNLRLRSKAENQQLLSLFNPISKKNWVYKYFFKERGANVRVLHTTFKDNKHLTQEYIDSLQEYKRTNPLYYSIYALGEFGNLGKKVFENWRVEEFDEYELTKENPDLEVAIGLDFGYTIDPTAIVSSFVDLEEKKIYVFDTVYKRGLLNNEIADIIHERGYGNQRIIADSAEPRTIKEIKRLGIKRIEGVKKGAGSVKHGIQYLQQFEIIIHPRCTSLIRELEDYSYKKDKRTNEYIEEPEGEDHLIDALRYSMTQFSSRNKVVFLHKSVFGL